MGLRELGERALEGEEFERRSFLKAVGAGGLASLAGCTGTGGGPQTPRATPTDDREGATPSNTTPTVTPTPRGTEVDENPENFYIGRSFEDFVRNEYFPSGHQQDLIDENFESESVDLSSPQGGEDLLKQIGSIPDIQTGTSLQQAYDTAKAAQYIASELLGNPIDPRENDSVNARHVPATVSGKNEYIVDVHAEPGRTTMAAAYGETTDSNILHPVENAGATNERRIESLTQLERGGKDSYFRVSHFDALKARINRVKRQDREINPDNVDFYHTKIGELIPDLHPAGKVPAQPQAWMTESGAKLLDQRVVENYEGMTPYLEIREGFRDNVEAGQIGRIYEDDGEFAVEAMDQDEYRNEVVFAPEP